MLLLQRRPRPKMEPVFATGLNILHKHTCEEHLRLLTASLATRRKVNCIPRKKCEVGEGQMCASAVLFGAVSALRVSSSSRDECRSEC